MEQVIETVAGQVSPYVQTHKKLTAFFEKGPHKRAFLRFTKRRRG